ncbi:MAG TPA: DoxX family membrane protein [Candidatus Acidoferrum sp.]|nr:DoxX family membrane protein [Candidatus Acidoferrum sp.]
MLPLSGFTDWSLLLLRLLVAAIYGSSGYYDLADPPGRAHSIEMSKPFTIFLGVAEVAAALSLITGVLIQYAAIGLVLIMLGSISKKIFAWKTGFWGKASQGWHYDLLLILINLVFLTTRGGKFVL